MATANHGLNHDLLERLMSQMLFDSQSVPRLLKQLHNADMRFYCPQTFLSLGFQCRDDVPEFKMTFRD